MQVFYYLVVNVENLAFQNSESVLNSWRVLKQDRQCGSMLSAILIAYNGSRLRSRKDFLLEMSFKDKNDFLPNLILRSNELLCFLGDVIGTINHQYQCLWQQVRINNG